jgi:hypothetical protein
MRTSAEGAGIEKMCRAIFLSLELARSFLKTPPNLLPLQSSSVAHAT